MSKRRMSFESDDHQDQEEASNSRERKLARRSPDKEADPNQEEEGEAPIPGNPNPEEEAQIPAQDLLFEKKLTFSEATCCQLSITGAHKATLMAFLTDAERDILAKNGGLMVPTRDANGNGVEYELELKRNLMTYFNGWRQVALANQVKIGDSVEGFGYRAAGKFRLNLNIIRNPNQEEEEAPIPNQEEGEAPIPANPNEEVPAQGLLFEKKLTATDTKRDQLVITGAHRATLVAFLMDEERKMAEEIGVGLMVPTTDANNGVEYVLELKKNKKRLVLYFNGWGEVARANQVNIGDSVQGFGYRAAGEFRLNLNIIRK